MDPNPFKVSLQRLSLWEPQIKEGIQQLLFLNNRHIACITYCLSTHRRKKNIVDPTLGQKTQKMSDGSLKYCPIFQFFCLLLRTLMTVPLEKSSHNVDGICLKLTNISKRQKTCLGLLSQCATRSGRSIPSHSHTFAQDGLCTAYIMLTNDNILYYVRNHFCESFICEVRMESNLRKKSKCFA